MFFRRKTTTLRPNKDANDTDLLKNMIRRLLEEIKEHNRDYQHVTPQTLVKEAKSLLGES
jgi:H2-forming N5,N10-methylenetetrahydromethanopterin dehydrogenase-like enzyme